MLEKAWNKYVYLNNLQNHLGGRYLDKIFLAFFGAPCEKLEIHQVIENNDFEYLKSLLSREVTETNTGD